GRFPRFDILLIENHAGAAFQKMQVPIHRVLIQWNEDVDLVAHVADRSVARANCQESVAAADDRLICVVGVEVQSTPGKNQRENVSSRCDPLAILTANSDCEINSVSHDSTGFCCWARKFAAWEANKQAKARALGLPCLRPPANACV